MSGNYTDDKKESAINYAIDAQLNSKNPYPKTDFAGGPHAVFNQGYHARDNEVADLRAKLDKLAGAFDKARTDGWTCYCPIDPVKGYIHAPDCPVTIAKEVKG